MAQAQTLISRLEDDATQWRDGEKTRVSARRRFFSFLGGAVATTALAPAAVAAARALPALQEDPRLLALGNRLDDLLARHGVAIEREAQAKAELAKLAPSLPQELIASPTESHLWTQAVRTDCNGVMQEDGRPLRVYTASLMQLWVDEHPEISRHTARSRRVRRLLRVAKRYETDVAEAERMTGIQERGDAVFEVRFAMQTLLTELIGIDPKTPVGVSIYARAVIAVDVVLKAPWRREASYGEQLGAGLAAAFLRLQKEAAHG